MEEIKAAMAEDQEVRDVINMAADDPLVVTTATDSLEEGPTARITATVAANSLEEVATTKMIAMAVEDQVGARKAMVGALDGMSTAQVAANKEVDMVETISRTTRMAVGATLELRTEVVELMVVSRSPILL